MTCLTVFSMRRLTLSYVFLMSLRAVKSMGVVNYGVLNIEVFPMSWHREILDSILGLRENYLLKELH